MKPEKELLEERARVIGQQEDLNSRASGRQMTDDETQQWEAMQVDVARLTGEIQRGRSLKENKALVAEQRVEAEARGGRAPKDNAIGNEGGKEAYRKAFDRWLRGGPNGLNAEQRSILTRGTNPQAVGTDSLGGYTVPEAFGDELIKSMAYYGGMLDVARVMRTQTGAAMPFPTVDETAVKGSLVAENAAMAVSDVTFGTKTLNAYMYTAGIIKLSYQLIQDNGVDLESELSPIMADRLGRIVNEHLTTGDGSGKPNGVVTAASAGVTGAATAAITRGELIDLQHSVDIAYRANARYMLNDNTIAAIRKLSLGSGDASPLWQPSMREGAPDLLEGKPYTINNDIADLGAGNVSALFGDFSKYRVRMVRDITMAEMNELYIPNLQKGFTAFMRLDADLLDTGAVKKYTNAAS